MNFEEYQQLLLKSQSFKSLDKETQEKIMNATGDDKQSYIDGFIQEADLIKKAFEQFEKDTDGVVTEFKVIVAKDRKKKLVKDEQNQHKKEVYGAENLLKNL